MAPKTAKKGRKPGKAQTTTRTGAKRRAIPTAYSPELGAELCERLATGLSVRTICTAAGMPAYTTVFQWIHHHPEFAAQYQAARVAGCEAIADEVFVIADDTSKDRVTRKLPNGKTVTETDHEHINRSRLRVDTRKWYLSKIVPKVFGDRIGLDVKGGVDINHRNPDDMSLIETAQRMAYIFAEASELMDKDAAPPDALRLPAPVATVERARPLHNDPEASLDPMDHLSAYPTIQRDSEPDPWAAESAREDRAAAEIARDVQRYNNPRDPSIWSRRRR